MSTSAFTEAIVAELAARGAWTWNTMETVMHQRSGLLLAYSGLLLAYLLPYLPSNV